MYIRLFTINYSIKINFIDFYQRSLFWQIGRLDLCVCFILTLLSKFIISFRVLSDWFAKQFCVLLSELIFRHLFRMSVLIKKYIYNFLSWNTRNENEKLYISLFHCDRACSCSEKQDLKNY